MCLKKLGQAGIFLPKIPYTEYQISTEIANSSNISMHNISLHNISIYIISMHKISSEMVCG